MGLHDWVTGVQCVLTPDQVREYELPTNPDALKHTDTRAKKNVQRFGNLVVELDALRPDALEGLVGGAMERWLDIDLLKVEREWQGVERARLQSLRDKVVALVKSEAP